MFTQLVGTTSIYAIMLCLMLFMMAISIIRLRVAHRISLMDGGHDDLLAAIRVLGNFSEYVPICLILMAFCELNQAPEFTVHILGVMLVTGRILHWAGLNRKVLKLRQIGMTLTFSCLLIGSLVLAYTLV